MHADDGDYDDEDHMMHDGRQKKIRIQQYIIDASPFMDR